MAYGLGAQGMMRVPEIHSRRQIKKGISLFILGFLCGAILLVQLSSKRIDNLDKRVIVLESENSDQAETIKKLHKEARPGPATILKISIHISDAPDDFAATKVIQQLKDDLSYLIDQPVDKVSALPQALYGSLQNREYQINERRFALHVQYFAIAKETHFWIKLNVPKVGPSAFE
jgi:hypothetical protein